MDYKLVEVKGNKEKLGLFFIKSNGKRADVILTIEDLMKLSSFLCKSLGTMTADDYQRKAKSFCTEESFSYAYLGEGIVSELGEFKDKIGKMVRKKVLPIHIEREDVLNLPEETRNELKKELGDLQWFVALTAEWFGWNLQDVMCSNIYKLADRKERNVIVGEGDNR